MTVNKNPVGRPSELAESLEKAKEYLYGGYEKFGDVGLASFCDRDISAVKHGGKAAPPSSSRKHDMSDAIYHMSIVSAAPSQYVQFSDSGITIHSPSKVEINAPSVSISGSVSITGGSLMHNEKNVGSTHVHGGISPGGADTSTPH